MGPTFTTSIRKKGLFVFPGWEPETPYIVLVDPFLFSTDPIFLYKRILTLLKKVRVKENPDLEICPHDPSSSVPE